MAEFSLSVQDLMVRVQQLEAHVTQLRNIVLKSDKEKAARRDKQRQFDFNKSVGVLFFFKFFLKDFMHEFTCMHVYMYMQVYTCIHLIVIC